ncbi:hypothetical protein FocTR4_00004527 [Fusarium oxysporum f. sp. cubense]|uniref:Carboxylesterase type B domain-containing protein n=1 Tax=Fusarium oxysporum f. sp. cubense TaxID=61366 RepID=A0A5C6THN1_FUSOC|nr:hypothetical protein FocTR4_00004527 [Fusarium oxysporum f. sp. cubense]
MGNSISYTTSECHVNLPNNGSLKGLQFDSKSRRFAGVPYAQPPVGNLRWRKPQPFPKTHQYESLDGSPFDATHFGPVCPQANYSKNVSEHIPKHAYSEDCLRLNIWTPVPDPNEPDNKWPVMVWFHGGWFQVGDPSQEESMDPSELISTGGLQAVFVAVGYRLNVFGFLAGKSLLEESSGEAVGNYGLWDQRLAMDWVYENIAAFGGDPENIILAGRSAGAYSVLAQALYDFRGKESHSHFTRMIMYSNAIPTQPKTVQDCEEQFDELCEYFGIPADISGAERLCNLRSISADDLSAAIMELKNHTFRPVTDDLFIHSGIFDYYRDGSFAREFKKRGLKLFIGEVLDEDTLYAVTNPPDPNISSLQMQISNYYPPHVTDRLLKHYSLPQTKDKKAWQQIFGRIIADGQVRAPSRYLVDNLVRNGVDIKSVWRYLIAYRLSFITNDVAPASFGVSHAMDRPIWNYSITHGPTPAERDLMDAWIRDLRAFVNDEEGRNLSHINPELKTSFKAMSQFEENIYPRWGSLAIEQYLLRDRLIQAFLHEDDVSGFVSSTLDATSNHVQELIQTAIAPWRSQHLRRIAEKYLPGNDLYGKLVVLRTHYGGVSDDVKFRHWVYDAATAFAEDNPLGDLFGDSEDHWWRILDDASLFDTGDQDWESIYNRFPELASSEVCRTFSDGDVAEVKEEVSAVVTSREPEEDDYEDAIAHAAVSGCWLLVLDRESFEDEEMLLVFRDKMGNVVRQSSIKPEDLEHIPHYIMRGSITESGFWRDAEIGKEYKGKGKIMREILPRVMAEAE